MTCHFILNNLETRFNLLSKFTIYWFVRWMIDIFFVHYQLVQFTIFFFFFPISYNHTNRKIECENSHVHTSVDWSIDQPHTTSTLCRVNEKIRSHGTDLFWFFFYFGVCLVGGRNLHFFVFLRKGRNLHLISTNSRLSTH